MALPSWMNAASAMAMAPPAPTVRVSPTVMHSMMSVVCARATIPAALIVLASPTATHWLMHAVCAMATVLAVPIAPVSQMATHWLMHAVYATVMALAAPTAPVSQMVLRSSMHVACVKAMIPAVPTVLVFPMVRRFSMHAASAKAMVPAAPIVPVFPMAHRSCRCPRCVRRCDGSSCADCAGVSNGPAVFDECGVCDGDGSSCADCAGVPNGPAVLDECGVCDGDGSTCAPSVIIMPEADALVNSYSPTTNYGLQEELRVDRGADESYLRFNLSAHIPAGATIESVVFKATAHTGFAWGSDGNVYTYLVEDDAWAEEGIHWNNRPSVTGDSLGHWWLWYDYSDFTVRVGQHATAEMTAEVQTQLDLDGLLSVRLHSPGYRTNYRSREYADASMRPRLEVDYVDCAGIHSGDAFLDNCGDCVGGTTGLVANDCSEPEPEPEPRLALAPALPWDSRAAVVVPISAGTVQRVMSRLGTKAIPVRGSIISGLSAGNSYQTALWGPRRRPVITAPVPVVVHAVLITVQVARLWSERRSVLATTWIIFADAA